MQTNYLQILHNRMAIHHAQSVMRSKFRKALEEFEQDMQRLNVDMTADVKLDISYIRKETQDNTHDKSKHRNNETNEQA